MADIRTLNTTKDEAQAGAIAVGYYLDTLDRCTIHTYHDEHGDETQCEGWGPKGIEDLEHLLRRLHDASH